MSAKADEKYSAEILTATIDKLLEDGYKVTANNIDGSVILKIDGMNFDMEKQKFLEVVPV